MSDLDRFRYLEAVQDFRRARRRAELERIVARLTGRPAGLLCYQDVAERLKAMGGADLGLQTVPLDAIVGSVGRCGEFTREFLPLLDDDQARWARVRAAAEMSVLPPVRLYKIDQVYFVLDGNHRVSIARQRGDTHIPAHVIELTTRVPLSPDDQPDDLIWKAEYAGFLERTRLDQLRPGADLSVSVAGQYRILEEHIQVHRYYMGLERKSEVPYEEAVAHWYDTVYLPLVEAIRATDILDDFPGRTETDLYVWISEYRSELESRLGWQIHPAEVAADLVSRASPRLWRVVSRLVDRLRERLIPAPLYVSAPPGHWRQEHLAMRRNDRLFNDILVALDGRETGWRALDHALEIARREEARLHAVHVIPPDGPPEEARLAALQDEFRRRCQAVGVQGDLAIEKGTVLHHVGERSQWADLIVVSLSYPPGPRLTRRLGSGLRLLLRHTTRPVLAVPNTFSPLDRLLLAYDGSDEADEALFVSTYLAGQRHCGLVVLTVARSLRAAAAIQARAQDYLEAHDVPALLVRESGPVVGAILKTAKAHGINLTVLGSYRRPPLVELLFGSTLEAMLRASRQPLLICR